jgi:hypothetical protein
MLIVRILISHMIFLLRDVLCRGMYV